jgi:hypothetical protein
MFTSEPTVDSPIRQKQAQLIPQLSKQLNELDSHNTFQLPEGPYTFEHERQARDIMEIAYSEYMSSSVPLYQPQAPIPSSSSLSPCEDNGNVQDGSGLRDTTAGPYDAIIDTMLPVPVDSEKSDGRDVDNSEIVVGNKQPEIP